jgi:signal transduction histidine kinase
VQDRVLTGVTAAVLTAAALVLLRRPGIGWSALCGAAAASHGGVALAVGWVQHAALATPELAGVDAAAWLASWLLPVEVVALAWMSVTAPDGRLPRGLLRWPALYAVAAPALAVVLQFLARVDTAGTDLGERDNPIAGGLFPLPFAVPFLLIAPAVIPVLWVVTVRWRRSTGTTRLAMRAVLVITVAGVLVPPFVPADGFIWVVQVMGMLQLLALVAVVLRHRLFGIDTLLERALAYSLLTACVLVLYVALAAAADRVFGQDLPAVVAAVVALLALPIRDVLRRWTTRFVFGNRQDPRRVMEVVATRTAGAGSPDEVLAAVLGEIATQLRLTRLSVRSGPGNRTLTATATGNGDRADTTAADGAGSTRIDLVHRARTVGELVASPRPGQDRLDPADVDALERLAPQLASLVDAAGAADALRASRDNLVRVREEERRRLRHDLHDGLGPVLTGVALTVDAARNTVDTDPGRADLLLDGARRQLTEAVGEVRRIVEGLRPLALDDLGLAGSIRRHSQQFPQLDIAVSEDGPLDDLPAAVEVAAYRIATEALTNAARHAGASGVSIQLRRNGALEVEVTDDGRADAPWTPGVGLTSMHERVAEVGGELEVGPRPGGGGRVLATLPVEP